MLRLDGVVHSSDLPVQSFATEGEAVELANDTRFGLAATIVTGDRERAERVASRLEAGTVWVNCFFVRDLGAPFGGSGHSGIGREGGTWSFDFYADVKNSVFAPNGWNEGTQDCWVRWSARRCSRTSRRSCCRSRPGAS